MSRILVADDEPDILHLVSMSLTMKGYEVKTASSKADFFKLLDTFRPLVIILDVMLGADNGRDICKEIKAAEHSDIPVILYSALPQMLDNHKECDADYTMEKPFHLSDLYDKVSKALSE